MYTAPLTITLFKTVRGQPTAHVLSDTMLLSGGGHCRLRTISASADDDTMRNRILPLVSDCQKSTAFSSSSEETLRSARIEMGKLFHLFTAPEAPPPEVQFRLLLVTKLLPSVDKGGNRLHGTVNVPTTAMRREPDRSSNRTLISTSPAFTAATIPVALTVASEGAADDHADAAVTSFVEPSEYRAVEANCALSPSLRLIRPTTTTDESESGGGVGDGVGLGSGAGLGDGVGLGEVGIVAEGKGDGLSPPHAPATIAAKATTIRHALLTLPSHENCLAVSVQDKRDEKAWSHQIELSREFPAPRMLD